MARVTTVINVGPSEAKIYEDRRLVFILAANTQRDMPMGGKHIIHAEGTDANITIHTKLRCDCEFPEPYVPIGDLSPVGSFLL